MSDRGSALNIAYSSEDAEHPPAPNQAHKANAFDVALLETQVGVNLACEMTRMSKRSMKVREAVVSHQLTELRSRIL